MCSIYKKSALHYTYSNVRLRTGILWYINVIYLFFSLHKKRHRPDARFENKTSYPISRTPCAAGDGCRADRISGYNNNVYIGTPSM